MFRLRQELQPDVISHLPAERPASNISSMCQQQDAVPLPFMNRGFNSCIFAFEDVLSEDDATGQQANTGTTLLAMKAGGATN